MSLRSFTIPAITVALLFSFNFLTAEASLLLKEEEPTIHVDFNECVSYFGGYNEDYSEFTGDVTENPDCSLMQLVGGFVYRRNASVNTHSCTPGLNSLAMCISSLDSCNYSVDNDRALRFDVLILPGSTGFGSISDIKFLSQAPEMFSFVDGETGANNYPTKMALRVLANGIEIYREIDIETSRNWEMSEFDFTSVPGFSVAVPTLFSFEILPYCLIGIESDMMAWDIDELTITGGCNDLNGGLISVNESSEICYPDSLEGHRSFNLELVIGSTFSWFILNQAEEIVALSDTSVFDFNSLENGIYTVYHISYDTTDFSGLLVGGVLEDIEGCFDLSNSIEIANNKLEAGELSSDESQIVFICSDDTLNNTIVLELDGSTALITEYLLIDTTGNILVNTTVATIDLSSFSEGSYQIIAVGHNGSLSNSSEGNLLSSLEGCFVLSNVIDIEKMRISAGQISFDGDDNFQACTTSSFELNPTLVDSIGGTSQWVLYTPNGMIVGIFDDTPIDVGMMLFPTLRLVHLSYLGVIEGLELGENINDLEGCFDVSNVLIVDIPTVEGGVISSNGLDSLNICVNDPIESMVEVLVEGISGTASSLIVTDENGLILGIPSDNIIDFSNAGTGICFIWNISFVNVLQGFSIGQNIEDIVGCYDLSNSIEVNRIELQSAELSLESGETEIEICSGDGESDSLIFNAINFSGPFSSLVVTDNLGNILAIPDSDIIDFEGVPDGLCLVYHLVSSNDSILSNQQSSLDSIVGCYELSNAVTVIRHQVIGGNLMTTDSLTEVSIVIGDNVSDEVDVILNDAFGEQMSWIITDTLGEILSIPSDPPFDFSTAGAGVCNIYNISYYGILTGLDVGSNVNDIVGCYDLSNAIIVNRIMLNGGVIVFDNGRDTVAICTGDPIVDSLNVTLTDFEGPLSSWIITDISGLILELPLGPPFAFENAPTGICQIWHISYTMDLDGLEVGLNVNELDGAFNLSNVLVVERTHVDGGDIMTVDSMTVVSLCTGDGIADIVSAFVEGEEGDSSAWIITDASDVILALPDSLTVDFDGAGAGTCFIYHISFYDNLTALAIDSSLNDLIGCYDLSNAITVIRTEVDGGIISEASGLDTINIVVGEGVVDSLEFSVIDAMGDSLVWVITDTTGMILSISSNPPVDFESAGEGVCLVYHLSYGAGIQGLIIGNNLNDIIGCFDLSNSITVIRTEVNGGVISSIDSLVLIDLCIQEMNSDSIDVLLSDEKGTEFQWIITDDLGVILALPVSPPFDFSNAPTGTCQIWHLASLGSVTGLTVGENIADITGVFDFSNPIEVVRQQVDGGLISHNSGLDTLMLITNDGIADSIDLNLVNAVGDSTHWIITDEQGLILALPDTLPFDFEGSAPGICLMWNISFNEIPEGLEIDSSAFDLGGCFDLSNAITIIRDHIQGGNLITVDSLTSVNVCLNDTIIDLIDVIVTDTFGMNFGWVITDTSGLILNLPISPPFDFSSAGAGICQIWHLSYQDNLMGLVEGNNVSDLTGSFDFSNPVEVIRDSLAGGSLTLLDGTTSDTIILGDGNIDTLEVVLNIAIGANLIYVVTDTLGEILDTTSNSSFTFENAGGGVCQIWNLSYANGLSGLEISNNVSQLSGCFDLSNPVTITRVGLMGGELMTTDSLVFIQICVSDTLSDVFDVILSDTVGPIQSWVVTDAMGIILDLPANQPFDLSSQSVATCFLWNLSHDMDITGLEIGLSVDSLVGNYNFSNAITVDKASSTASSIMTTDSLTAVSITVGEGIVDLINAISAGGDGDSSVWVITDPMGTILVVQDTASFDFESSGGGTCLIWEINFEFGISGLSVGANINNLQGCFSISNSIEVMRIPTPLNGGVLTTSDFLIAIEICVGNGLTEEIDVVLNFNQGPNFQWVITDTTGLILGLPAAPPFDLSLAGPGLCQIWNLSYANGLTGLSVGLNINGLQGFFDFSNAISVTRNAADGGEIETTGGMTEITIPVGEGVIDSVDIVLTGEEGDTQMWIVTDTNNVIINLNATSPFTFENNGGGACLIWNLASTGAVSGLMLGNNLSELEGCFDLSNAVTVTKDGPNGGILSDINGNSSVEFCNTDSFSDSLEVVLTGTIGSMNQWIIVDSSGVIISLPVQDPFDLSALSLGTCYLYNMAFDSAPTGISLGDTLANAMGTYHVSNALEIFKVETFGGSLTFEDGSLIDTIMVGEGIIDTVEVTLTGQVGEINQWVVTDTFGVILDLPISDPFDFESAGGGVCLIWNLAFQVGIQGLSIGNNVNQLDGCYSFSNSIMIVRDGLNGGLLRFDDMTTVRETCFGDGLPDLTTYVVSGAQGLNDEFFFARTNGQLQFLNAPNPFDFELIPANIDTFVIYNIAYDTIPGGYNQGNFISNLTGNFSLSNPIFLVRDIQRGGSIQDTMGFTSSTIIVADGVVDTLTLEVAGTFADSMAWVMTNDNDTIIAIQNSNEFIFDSLGTSECRIYHIGFNPDIIDGLEIGESIDSITGCYGISNVYILTKKALNGGVLSTTTGETSIEICSGDNNVDIVNLITEGEIGSSFVFIVANLNGIILLNQVSSQLDLTGVQPGMCQIFSISHDGSLGGVANGVNISSLTGCFLLSTPVDVVKNAVFGGNLTLQSGGTVEDVCVGDAIEDNVIWQTTSMSGEYFYAITDTFNVIDTIISNGVFDFNDSDVGVCRIWGISYVGTLTAEEGDTVGVDVLAEDCFDISNNFIQINKNDCTIPAALAYKVYPNPVIDRLRLDVINVPNSNTYCQIFDSSGKVLHQQNIGLGEVDIDMSSLMAGVYYIRVKSGGYIKTDKFIVLK